MPAREGSRHYRGAKAFWDDINLVVAKGVARVEKTISCKFNMETTCMKLRFADGMIFNCTTPSRKFLRAALSSQNSQEVANFSQIIDVFH